MSQKHHCQRQHNSLCWKKGDNAKTAKQLQSQQCKKNRAATTSFLNEHKQWPKQNIDRINSLKLIKKFTVRGGIKVGVLFAQ